MLLKKTELTEVGKLLNLSRWNCSQFGMGLLLTCNKVRRVDLLWNELIFLMIPIDTFFSMKLIHKNVQVPFLSIIVPKKQAEDTLFSVPSVKIFSPSSSCSCQRTV